MECSYVRFPVGLVEIDCKEPTGLVFEERIDPSDMSPLEMVEDHLVGYRHEGLVGGQSPHLTRGLSHRPGTHSFEQAGE
jgi:hypothetical protein